MDYCSVTLCYGLAIINSAATHMDCVELVPVSDIISLSSHSID